jgi:hypothetical protein
MIVSGDPAAAEGTINLIGRSGYAGSAAAATEHAAYKTKESMANGHAWIKESTGVFLSGRREGA